jgi:LPS export ABC transporter protein LptC
LNAAGKISCVKLTAIVFTIYLLLASCNKKLEIIKKSDIESYPTETVKDFWTEYSDSSLKQLYMSSPLMERYADRKPPYAEFTKGIKVLFYDGHKDPVGYLTSKYARLNEEKRLWEMKDSVVVVNEKKDTLRTELLYWDQNKELVYTDRFVKITSTSQERVTMGTGLEANSRFTWYKIRNISSIFYVSDEK